MYGCSPSASTAAALFAASDGSTAKGPKRNKPHKLDDNILAKEPKEIPSQRAPFERSCMDFLSNAFSAGEFTFNYMYCRPTSRLHINSAKALM